MTEKQAWSVRRTVLQNFRKYRAYLVCQEAIIREHAVFLVVRTLRIFGQQVEQANPESVLVCRAAANYWVQRFAPPV
jgi:hypothetical protein